MLPRSVLSVSLALVLALVAFCLFPRSCDARENPAGQSAKEPPICRDCGDSCPPACLCGCQATVSRRLLVDVVVGPVAVCVGDGCGVRAEVRPSRSAHFREVIIVPPREVRHARRK